MVKRAAAALTLAGVMTAGAGPARGQALQRLTVESFQLSADTMSPRVETPFHLILSLRVRQHATQIENLDLPLLAALELLGDERETASGASGTQYRETITVVAHDEGTVPISPATLQAIDARDGRAKQWFSNALTLHVAGNPSRAVSAAARAVGSAIRIALWFLLWLLAGVVGIALLVVVGFVLLRRRPPEPAGAAPANEPPVPVRTRRQQAMDALAVLGRERTRLAAIAVRAAIWRMVGATDGETLGDVLRRPDARDEPIRQLLVALERSAFTYDSDLAAAIEDACCALERYIGSTT